MQLLPASRPAWYPLPRSWRAHAIEAKGSVLLETAGGSTGEHISYLFTEPQQVLRASDENELTLLLNEIESATQGGLYATGYLHYEAGYVLQDFSQQSRSSFRSKAKTPAFAGTSRNLATFGLFSEPLRFDHHTGAITGPAIPFSHSAVSLFAAPAIREPHIRISREEYKIAFDEIQRLLTAGDTYQVNLTTRVDAKLLGSSLDLYESLIEAQPVDYATIIHLDDDVVLSFSPELFFRISNNHIQTRPMKGTAPRGASAAEDEQQRAWLAADEKNRAEHLMIVDLLRNDLGQICDSGSVRTDDLFKVETYPTLLQMTSSISGDLRVGTTFTDICRALFPSGSITGAPKRRTMEIIQSLEPEPRGVYTGAIGFIAPNNDACFSVPIRTLTVSDADVSMGVGGGIVADSTVESEYDECLLKTSFLHQASTAAQLIETLLWEEGFSLLDLHLARLQRSAAELGFSGDFERIRHELIAAAGTFSKPTRVRLLLSAEGESRIESRPLTGPATNLRVRIAARRISSSDVALRHKTTRRTLYDREFAQAQSDGFDEVFFLNERDELAEGAISNLFVQLGGTLCTPPLAAGALPGVLRRHLLQTRSDVQERTLHIEDLAQAEAVYAGNALRGLRLVSRLEFE